MVKYNLTNEQKEILINWFEKDFPEMLKEFCEYEDDIKGSLAENIKNIKFTNRNFKRLLNIFTVALGMLFIQPEEYIDDDDYSDLHYIVSQMFKLPDSDEGGLFINVDHKYTKR